jgi:hypothetical protein
MAHASTIKEPRRLDQSEILASAFASVILSVIVFFSGHWKDFEFWVAAALLVGLAYLVSLIPDHLRWWRLPFLFLGYFSPGIGKWLFNTDNALFSIAILFLLTFYWMPVVRLRREPFGFYLF